MKRAYFAMFGLGAMGAILIAACDGQSNSTLYDEPFRVRGAQFIAGDLPGAPPVATADDSDAGVLANGPPVVTAISAASTVVAAGAGAKSIGGRATNIASSVALRFTDIGSGYWVFPMGGPDPLYPGELTWSASCDFDANIAAGRHTLRVVGIDEHGNAGTQSEQKFCFAGRIPDNLNACDPTRNPPEAVISLQWDADVDLDLHVISPEGRDINPKNPLVEPVDAGVQPSSNAPLIDRDSMASCIPDAHHQEDLVFQGRPTGTWQIYVNMFSACGKPSTTFTVSVYEPEGTLKVDRHLVQTFSRSGRLLELNAAGDSARGLFIAEYPF